MAKRLSRSQRLIYYSALVERDGDSCHFCSAAPTRVHGLEIHHKNGDAHDWRGPNLTLACKSCNVSEGNQRRRKSLHRNLTQARIHRVPPSDHLESEREKIAALQDEIDLTDASAETRLGRLYERRFLSWLEAYVAEEGQVRLPDAINWGAQVAGCGVQTTTRYCRKLGTPYDRFERFVDANGQVLLRLRVSVPIEERLDGHRLTRWGPEVKIRNTSQGR